MEKDFATYDQALVLKVLGFNEPCFGFYDDIDKVYFKKYIMDSPYNEVNNITMAPLKQQVFRFFRENYGLNSEIYLQNELDKGYYHYLVTQLVKANILYRSQNTKKFETYDEAETECIDKLIELIKNN